MSQGVLKTEEGVDRSKEEDKAWQSEALPLQNRWTLWYDEKVSKGMGRDSYASSLKKLGEFGTVQEFWAYMNHIDVGELPVGSNLRMFKTGIEPTWEDPANQNGGKYVYEVPSGVAIKDVWTYTLLALVGETFENNDSLCGAVLSLRPRNLSTVNIWNNSFLDPEDIALGEQAIQRLIVAKLADNKRQPVTLQLHYQPHQKSLDWNHLWTTSKSKEQVMAQLAASSDSVTLTKKTLTSSPLSARRAKLTVENSPAKAPLRSSTGSMPLVGHQHANDSTRASGPHSPHRNGSQPHLGHHVLSEARKNSVSSYGNQRSSQKPRSTESSPRLSSPASSSSPSAPNPLQAGLSTKNMDDIEEMSASNDLEDDMRSPFLMLSAPPAAASPAADNDGFSQSLEPMHKHSRAGSSGPKESGKHSRRSSKPSSVSPRIVPPGQVQISPRASISDWSSISSMTDDLESAVSTVSTRSSDFSANFSAVLQEIRSQWWNQRRNRRRGRPSNAQLLAAASTTHPSSTSPSSTSSSVPSFMTSSDSQLKVPEAGENAQSFLPGSSSPAGGLSTSAPTSEKKKRKRPSRGGSRDKGRSKEASPAISPSPTPPPSTGLLVARVPENSSSQSSHDSETIIHDVSTSTTVDLILESTDEGVRQRLGESKGSSPAASASSVSSSLSGSSVSSPASLERHASFASEPPEEILIVPPSVVIVPSEPDTTVDAKLNSASAPQEANVAGKHHRKRSRGGRGQGSYSRKLDARTTSSDILKSVGMIFIILVLMALCFMLGRLQGGAPTALPDFFSSSASSQPIQTMAQPQPRLTRHL
jgi:translation initiation factor 4E